MNPSLQVYSLRTPKRCLFIPLITISGEAVVSVLIISLNTISVSERVRWAGGAGRPDTQRKGEGRCGTLCVLISKETHEKRATYGKGAVSCLFHIFYF